MLVSTNRPRVLLQALVKYVVTHPNHLSWDGRHLIHRDRTLGIETAFEVTVFRDAALFTHVPEAAGTVEQGAYSASMALILSTLLLRCDAEFDGVQISSRPMLCDSVPMVIRK